MKIPKKLSIALLLVLATQSVFASEKNEPMTLKELKSSLKDASGGGAISALLAQSGGNPAMTTRAYALIDSAKTIGIQAGIAYENARLKKLIDQHSRDLDTIYNFALLMVNSRVVPPVISETREIYTQEGDNTIRLSGALFKIEKQAYFSSNPPNWRGYISVEELSKKSILDNAITIRPKTSAENAAWEEGLEDGWKEGREQARKIIEYQFDSLNRDFLGMFRFKRFAAQGKITLPIVAQDRLQMTQTDNSIVLDEQLIQLTQLPRFTADVENWSANQSMVSSEPYPLSPRHKVTPPNKSEEAIIETTPGFNPVLVDTPALKSHTVTKDDLNESKGVFQDVR